MLGSEIFGRIDTRSSCSESHATAFSARSPLPAALNEALVRKSESPKTRRRVSGADFDCALAGSAGVSGLRVIAAAMVRGPFVSAPGSSVTRWLLISASLVSPHEYWEVWASFVAATPSGSLSWIAIDEASGKNVWYRKLLVIGWNSS